ncbi:MAG TPA: lipid-binding SYLF domain-containing protein [Myxococcota bacterium]|nr:lipid-binding SYLF domain-containing protein [Myxococcota bacterium]
MIHKAARALTCVLVGLAAAAAPALPRRADAASAAEIRRDSAAALKNLYATEPVAKMLSQKAKGILVFPSIVKGGFMVGGQIGEGSLQKNGKTVGYYNSVAASYGLQAGIQTFGYALFFMNDAALKQLDDTRGFEIGVGPSIVVVDAGVAKSMTTNTLTSDVYAFIFSQKGLMAGLGVQGSKITKIAK